MNEQDTHVSVLYHGTGMVEIVSSRKGAGAWRLTRTAGGFDEKAPPVWHLGV